MRLAVLETGAPPAPLDQAFGGYPDMFRALLGEGYDWRTYDVQQALPDRAEDNDAYIVTGSAAGVYDSDPWIGALLDFLRGARGWTRLIGVCFGHQAMAQAFGGRVIKSPKGWGVGLHSYDVRALEPWMDPVRFIRVPASHQDQVVELPPRSEVLAGSDFTPYGMLAHGQDAISIQLHPEFEPAYAEALIESRRETRLPQDQADAAIASLRGPNDNARVGRWLRRFLER